MYSINFTEKNKNSCLSLHYNNTNSYLFVNGTKTIKFNSKNSYIIWYPLCFGNILKDWPVDNMKKNQKKTGFNVFFNDFSVDCDDIAVDDILDKNNIIEKKII